MKNKIRLTPYFISLISPIGMGTLLIFSWLYILPIIFILFFLRFIMRNYKEFRTHASYLIMFPINRNFVVISLFSCIVEKFLLYVRRLSCK